MDNIYIHLLYKWLILDTLLCITPAGSLRAAFRILSNADRLSNMTENKIAKIYQETRTSHDMRNNSRRGNCFDAFCYNQLIVKVILTNLQYNICPPPLWEPSRCIVNIIGASISHNHSNFSWNRGKGTTR